MKSTGNTDSRGGSQPAAHKTATTH